MRTHAREYTTRKSTRAICRLHHVHSISWQEPPPHLKRNQALNKGGVLATIRPSSAHNGKSLLASRRGRAARRLARGGSCQGGGVLATIWRVVYLGHFLLILGSVWVMPVHCWSESLPGQKVFGSKYSLQFSSKSAWPDSQKSSEPETLLNGKVF